MSLGQLLFLSEGLLGALIEYLDPNGLTFLVVLLSLVLYLLLQ